MEVFDLNIVIPEKIGSELRLMSGTTEAELSAVHIGESQTGNPKCTLEFTVVNELSSNPDDPDNPSTIGEKCLETCSLLENAVWKLNDYYKAATGEQLPMGNYSKDEFESILINGLVGSRWNIELAIEPDNRGNNRTQIKNASFLSK